MCVCVCVRACVCVCVWGGGGGGICMLYMGVRLHVMNSRFFFFQSQDCFSFAIAEDSIGSLIALWKDMAPLSERVQGRRH